MSLVIASQVSVAAFGAYGLAYAIFVICQGATRAFVGEALLVNPGGHDGTNVPWMVTAKISLLLSLVGAAGAGVAGAALGSEMAMAMFPLAIALPALLIQDSLRYVFFTQNRPELALKADAVWFVFQFIGFGLLFWTGWNRLEFFILAWGIGAAFSVGYQIAVLHGQGAPGSMAVLTWWNRNRELSPRFLLEFMLLSSVQQGIIFAVAAVGGLAEAGAIRSAQVLMGPANFIILGIAVVVLPAAAAVVRSNNRKGLKRFGIKVSLALSACTGVYVLLVLLLPDSLGAAILGDSWESGALLAPVLGLAIILSNLSYGATSAVRAAQRAKASLRMRLVTVPLSLVLVCLGAAHDGARGALVGLVVANLVNVVCWWTLFLTITSNSSTLLPSSRNLGRNA